MSRQGREQKRDLAGFPQTAHGKVAEPWIESPGLNSGCSFSFRIKKKKSQPNRTLAGFTPCPKLAGRGASWLSILFFWLSSRAPHWFVQEKLSLFRPEQKVDFRSVLGFELDRHRQVFRFQFQ